MNLAALAWKALAAILEAVTKRNLAAAGAAPTSIATLTVPLGTGYSVPQPSPGLRDSRDLAHCHPELARRYQALRADYEAEVCRQLVVTSTYRSPEAQAALYAQGRTAPGAVVTKLDGSPGKRSRHNRWPSEALDVAVDIDPGPGKHISWDTAAYAPLGPLAARHGLRWGGDWNGDGLPNETFVDLPHLELPPGEWGTV